jgi:tetratricopeptide (TPR) repeat protein
LTLRGFIEMQNHDLEAAQQYLEQAIHIDPYASAPYIALGVVYNHAGRYAAALHASERGVSLSPRSWQGYFEMATASIAKGLYERSAVRQASGKIRWRQLRRTSFDEGVRDGAPEAL